MIEYGEAMQGYADVARAPPKPDRRAAVPDADDRSWWVGLVDADPVRVWRRPLVESLESDASCTSTTSTRHPAAGGGLTDYRAAVADALKATGPLSDGSATCCGSGPTAPQ